MGIAHNPTKFGACIKTDRTIQELCRRTEPPESRLLRMSSIGMRRTSLIEWPAWLKCSDTGVIVLLTVLIPFILTTVCSYR